MRPKAVVCLAGVFLLVGGGCHQVPQPPSRMVTPFDGLVVLPDIPAIEIQAWTCLDAGWLEQIACSPATREHESLVVMKPRPSEIHAAMLLAGFQPGSPGKWSYDNDALEFTPPTGDRLDVFVRYESASGETIQEPIRNWIQDHLGRAQFPDDPWVFSGSAFAPNPRGMDPGEQYVADMTGSIVGLVTFGDEVIGFSHVWADQQAVQPPQWQVRSDYLPPVGTPVTLILRRVPGDVTASP